MINGIDISSYQPNWIPTSGETFFFSKATQGTTYRNPDHHEQVGKGRAHGLVAGHYHYMEPGDAANLKAQAAYFSGTPDIQPGDMLAIDWELRDKHGNFLIPGAQKDQLIRDVKALRPHCRVGLYCDVDSWLHNDHTSFAGDFLWIAEYGVKLPTISHPWTFWQYQGSPVDLDYGNFITAVDLASWAHGLLPKGHPAPKPRDVTYVVKPGDTLGEIAKRYKTTIAKIDKANKIITNRDHIEVGWKITIPA